MNHIIPALAAASLLIGCAKQREPAPEEMEDLTRFIYQHYDDDERLSEGLENLSAWLIDNVDTEDSLAGYELDDLTEENIDAVTHPTGPLEGMIGAAAAMTSPHGITDHVTTMLLDDQVFSNPKNYNSYHRDFEGDTDAFDAGSGRIRTINDVETGKLGITIPYILMKDYSWVQTASNEDAVVCRSWIEEEACNDGGGTCVKHSYSVDIFLPKDDDTLRFTATWSELTSPIDGLTSEDFLVAQLAKGLIDVFESSDEFIADGMPAPED